MEYRLTVSYRGGQFAGWQRQTNALAVQQVIEEALADLVGGPVRTVGAGRTDRGVHARGQVVSLRLAADWSPRALVHGTNERLRDDVRVVAAATVPAGFDARKHARAKEYRYRFVRTRVVSPLDALSRVALAPTVELDVVRRATRSIVGRHDFTAFAKSGGAHTDPRRTIHRAEWDEEGERVSFRVVGDGFLRGMVRALVGTLIEIGRGRWDEERMRFLLDGRPRSDAGPNAPAHGLELVRVFYPSRWGGPPGGW